MAHVYTERERERERELKSETNPPLEPSEQNSGSRESNPRPLSRSTRRSRKSLVSFPWCHGASLQVLRSEGDRNNFREDATTRPRSFGAA